MIDAKKAVDIANNYLKSVYEASFPGLQLEEIELSEDQKFWLITLGYIAPGASPFLYPPPKEYKSFKIDSETGNVISMKIRQVRQ
jgi:hypothetical protein